MDRLLFNLRNASHVIVFLILAATSIAVAFFISQIGVMVAYILIVLLMGLSVLVVTISNFRNGFLIMVMYSYFLFVIGRLLPFQFPTGILMEVFYVLISVSILIQNNKGDDLHRPNVFKNQVGISILLYIGYALLEMLNPNSHSLAPRVLALREMLPLILLFYISMNVFNSQNYILFFTKFWLVLAMIVALYGIYQEHVGLFGFEQRWLYASPERYKLYFIWGRLRKWSLLSDVSAFGIFGAYSGTICAILALGPFQTKTRIILAISAFVMLVSMTYSGTRTGIAMVVIGLGFYFLLTMTNRKTLIFATCSVMIFLVLIFGPFYGSTLNRIRSTFNASEDPSMGVRNYKRAWLQPYAREHPIGGGINTVGTVGQLTESNHPLAGPYDPDSGYLRMALERGWIGLIVNLGIYASILMYGVRKYYSINDKKSKILYAAYMAGFFSLTIANYLQDAMLQKPIFVIYMSSFAIFVRLAELERPKTISSQLV